ncbi:MAG TPA: ATP-binding protein [Syntrophomonas sp.]|nr:ATP-binding protein [Syntrophomonas sp.]
MILREHYIQELRPFYESDLIKIITGIRRCGKSVLMQQIRDEILKKTDNIIYLEFENRKTRSAVSSADKILDYIDSHRGEGKCYIFMDEIQEIPNWAEACQTLRLGNNSVFITGSNSKLLSKEFTRALSGRYVSFLIRPFVYKELREYADDLGKEAKVTDYLVWGGFPKRLEFTGEAMLRYLEDLDETIIYKDIIVRYKIRKEELFRTLADFVLRSNGRTVSANSIYKAVKQKHTCSENTISKYIGYLEDAYAIGQLKLYSTRTKQELAFYKKTYNGDVALNSIRCMDNRFDLDHNLENVVYNELLYMGYKLYVYNNHGREIDFLAQKGNRRYYVQAAYSVQDDKAYAREFSAFENLGDPLSQRILITNDEIDYSTSIVRHVPLKDFLLMTEL